MVVRSNRTRPTIIKLYIRVAMRKRERESLIFKGVAGLPPIRIDRRVPIMSAKVISLEARRQEVRYPKGVTGDSAAVVRELPVVNSRHLVMAVCGILAILSLAVEFSVIGHQLSYTEARRMDAVRASASVPVKPEIAMSAVRSQPD